MKQIIILINLALASIFFTGCGEKPILPESELVNLLEDKLSAEQKSLSISEVVIEPGSDNLFNWKAKVTSNGTYYTGASKDDFIAKYFLSPILESQSRAIKSQSSSKGEFAHSFPELPDRYYKKIENREKEIYAEGTVEAEFFQEKWTTKLESYTDETKDKLGDLTRGIEEGELASTAVVIGSNSAKSISMGFREKTEKEITRVSNLKKEILSHREKLIDLGENKKRISMRYFSKDDPEAQNIPVIVKFTDFTKNESEFSTENLRNFEGLKLGSFKGVGMYGKIKSDFKGKVTLLDGGVSHWKIKLKNNRKLNTTIEFCYDGEKLIHDEELKNVSVK